MSRAAFKISDVLGTELPIVEVMDIGASDIAGLTHIDLLFGTGYARITGFEPDEEQYAKLINNKSDDKKQYFPYFIGNGEKAVFNITHAAGCSSLLKPNAELLNHFSYFKAVEGSPFHVLKSIEVETKRLDDIEECPLPDLMKLDIQGAELDVLKNASKALSEALVLQVETEFVELYENQPLFGDVQSYLKTKGFVVHKMIDIGGRCFEPTFIPDVPFRPMSQLLWSDTIFVRDFTKLDSLNDEKLIKMVMILHESYFSYDLCLFILSHLDKRNQSKYAEKYIQKLSSSNIQLMFMTQTF